MAKTDIKVLKEIQYTIFISLEHKEEKTKNIDPCLNLIFITASLHPETSIPWWKTK